MTLKLIAHPSDYHTEHTLNLTSKRIKLAEHDNSALHQHYDSAVDYLLQYWNTHYQLGKYSDIHAHLDSNLHWSPIKKKGQKVPSKEVRRLTHSKDVHHLEGKYYTHRQLLNMMAQKANKTPYKIGQNQCIGDSMHILNGARNGITNTTNPNATQNWTN